MFVHCRKRFSLEALNRINEAIVSAERAATAKDDSDQDQEDQGPPEAPEGSDYKP